MTNVVGMPEPRVVESSQLECSQIGDATRHITSRGVCRDPSALDADGPDASGAMGTVLQSIVAGQSADWALG